MSLQVKKPSRKQDAKQKQQSASASAYVQILPDRNLVRLDDEVLPLIDRAARRCPLSEMASPQKLWHYDMHRMQMSTAVHGLRRRSGRLLSWAGEQWRCTSWQRLWGSLR